jgi:hypothetical protein
MMDITGANASLQLTQATLFPVPQQIQGFAADDIYDLDEIESVETLMGVDGVLSGGFVWKPQSQSIMLQADSPSNAFFDAIQSQQIAANTTYVLNGVLTLPAIGLKFIQTTGYLTGYKLPGAKKLIQPRRYRIMWNLVLPAPV